jgi:Fe-S-cluster containining protein
MDIGDLARTLAATTGVDYDCRRCGACCLSPAPLPGYVELTATEARHFRLRSLPVVAGPNGSEYLGTEPYDGPGGSRACIGFEGAPGFPCACRIYAERPAKCCDFEMGSAACRAARLRAGLPI